VKRGKGKRALKIRQNNRRVQMSEYREDMNQSYWNGFIRHMTEKYPQYMFGRPSKGPYQVVPPKLNTGVQIAAAIHRKGEEWIHVDVTLTNTPPEWFKSLFGQRKKIETEVGITDGRWVWDERAGKPESHIILKKSARLDGERTPQYAWLGEAVHRFHQVFGPRVSSFS
jgi:hypothetical protein